MENIQADTEILEFAIAREEDAYSLYTSVAEQIEDIQLRAIFEDFARDELEHKAKLELEYMKTGKVLRRVPPSEPKLQAFFVNSDIKMTYRNILQFAIDKEDAAYKLYANMASQAQDLTSRDMLLAMAEEEVKHKLRFQTAYNNLSPHI